MKLETEVIEATLFYGLDVLDKAIEKAEAKGMTVYGGSENVLLLDLDTPESQERYTTMRQTLDSMFGIVEEESWESKSGNQHKLVRISVPVPDPAMRVALQAACGSDPRRELFAVALMQGGREQPSYLFRPKATE
jgi:hypothetical protein